MTRKLTEGYYWATYTGPNHFNLEQGEFEIVELLHAGKAYPLEERDWWVSRMGSSGRFEPWMFEFDKEIIKQEKYFTCVW
jgi:hypothetical protein